MRMVRLGQEPTRIGADIRAAVQAWGQGNAVLGGVAIFGCTPPGGRRPLDAVLVLPRGIIVVTGVDLPEPALKLEAPVHTPWLVDGWPMVRTEKAVNPAFEGLQAASALARSLQSRGVEPLPVTTIVAVGPYIGQVIQPTSDLHRGVRVLHPSTTTMLSAARELATYERACPVEPTQRLLRLFGERPGRIGVAELTAEGFPDTVSPDLATAETMLITKVTDRTGSSAAPPARKGSRTPFSPRAKLLALSLALVVVCGVITTALLAGSPEGVSESARSTQRIDGVSFERQAADESTDCAQHSFGDVQAWFTTHSCRSLRRLVFDTEVADKPAAVAVADVELADTTSAQSLHGLLNIPGSGGITDLVEEGESWAGGPDDFGGAAYAVQRDGTRIRVVRAVWSEADSAPDDVRLRALVERGMRRSP